MEHGITMDIDPLIFTLGPFQIRWYGTCFMVMFWIAFLLWRYYIVRSGRTTEAAVKFLPWFLGGLLLGARLGHCLFYEPHIYLEDPVRMIYFWKGGLSSHGATIGLLIALFIYSRLQKMHYIDVVDRFSPSAAVGAAMVRLGNFFNSEIVGRETDLPWAIRFMRYDEGRAARHPTQLYEFLLGVGVLILLLIVDKRAGKEKRPRGLIMGAFTVAYFGGRFFIEFTKEYQGIDDGWSLTMGQWLCIPFFLVGLVLLEYARRRPSQS